MCLNPISITREIAGRKYTQVVPCSKCIQCKINDQNEYVQRCINAANDYGQVWFVTLTYNNGSVPVQYNTIDPSNLFDQEGEIIEDFDSCVSDFNAYASEFDQDLVYHEHEEAPTIDYIDPETGEISPRYRYLTLNREDIKKWKKRVKIRYERKYGKRLSLKYILCGEYGPQTHRPHYHGMFFGLDKEAAQMLQQDWQENYGFTCFKFIPSFSVDGSNQVEKVARYCSKYCVKVNELEDQAVKDEMVQKPRKITSQGLGVPSLAKMVQLQRYQLCKDIFQYDENNPSRTLNNKQQKQLLDEIKKRRKASKLPKYLLKKLFYYKDSFGRPRASEIQKMVSRSLQMDIQKDYSRELAEVAAGNNLPESPEGLAQANKIVQSRQEDRRKEIYEVLLKTQKQHLRKSRF